MYQIIKFPFQTLTFYNQEHDAVYAIYPTAGATFERTPEDFIIILVKLTQ